MYFDEFLIPNGIEFENKIKSILDDIFGRILSRLKIINDNNNVLNKRYPFLIMDTLYFSIFDSDNDYMKIHDTVEKYWIKLPKISRGKQNGIKLLRAASI